MNGVEKIRKKKKLKSCPHSNVDSNEFIEKNSNQNYSKFLNCSKNYKSSRNIYSRQIQWKNKILLKNEKKKIYKEKEKNLECTFKPKVNTKSIKYLFQKSIEERKEDISNKSKRNSKTNYLNFLLKNIPISKSRYFIINKEKNINNMLINKKNLKEKYKEKKI